MYFSLILPMFSPDVQLGEFKYQLELFAEPAEAIVLPELSAELGGRPRVATIRVDNPFNDRSAAFTVTTISGDGRCFQASPSTVGPVGG